MSFVKSFDWFKKTMLNDTSSDASPGQKLKFFFGRFAQLLRCYYDDRSKGFSAPQAPKWPIVGHFRGSLLGSFPWVTSVLFFKTLSRLFVLGWDHTSWDLSSSHNENRNHSNNKNDGKNNNQTYNNNIVMTDLHHFNNDKESFFVSSSSERKQAHRNH